MKNQLEKSRPPTMRPTTGMMRSLTSESTILQNAPPMITPTARSTTLPLTANSRNSLMNDMVQAPYRTTRPPRSPRLSPSHRSFARFTGADTDHLFNAGHEDLAIADL